MPAIDRCDRKWGRHACSGQVHFVEIALSAFMDVGSRGVAGKEGGELRAGGIVLVHVRKRYAEGIMNRGKLRFQLQRGFEFVAAFVEALVLLVFDALLLKSEGDA